MDLTMIVLRLFHIFGAALWTGFAFFLAFFLVPAVELTGAAGTTVLRTMLTRTRFMMAMPLTGAMTIISGFILLWKDSTGFDPAWMGSKTGIVYSTAALLGVVAGMMGGHTGSMIGAKIAGISQAVDAAGGTVTAEQAAEFTALQRRLAAGGRRVVVILSLTLAGMIAARHIFI